MDPALFQRWLREAVWLPIVAAFILVSLSLWRVLALESAFLWVDHSDQVIAQATLVERLMIDAETGIRGFVITKEEEFLAPHTSARKALPSEFGKLEALVADNPAQVRRVQELKGKTDEWLAIADRALDALQRGQDPTRNAPRTGGKRIMDEVRLQFDHFIAVEQKVRAERAQDAKEFTHFAIVTGIATTLLIGIALALRTRKRMVALSDTYQSNLLQLYDSREWFSTTLSSIGDAVMVVDTQSRVEYLNPPAEKLTGWSFTEARGRPMEEVFRIVHQETRAPAFNPVARVLKEGVVVGLANHTMLIARDGKEYPIEDSAAPIRERTGEIRGVVLAFHDVTEKYRTNVELKTLNTDLRFAVEARDAFLSIASHELKTPLTSLKLQLQLAEKGVREGQPPSPEKLAHTLSVSLKQAVRLTKLIDDLLDVSRIQSGKLAYQFEEVNLRELAVTALASMDDQFQEVGCPISIEDGHDVSVRGDRFRLEQVVVNLLTNALKYGAGKPVQIRVRAERNQGVIEVRDNGPGIAPENHALIFERFERAAVTPGISGLGLGLYITRQIILAHEGQIDLTSSPGKGSTFTVRLPLWSGRG